MHSSGSCDGHSRLGRFRKRIKLVRGLGQNVRATRAVQAEWKCFADSENRILSNIATKKLKLIFRSPKLPEAQNACYLI